LKTPLVKREAFLAIGMGCLGHLRLASLTCEQRTSGIGIRKVLGALAAGILHTLTRDFFLPVVLASAVACPIAYYLMHQWLQAFAYRIDLTAHVFLISNAAALGMAQLTVGYQVLKKRWRIRRICCHMSKS